MIFGRFVATPPADVRFYGCQNEITSESSDGQSRFLHRFQSFRLLRLPDAYPQ
jgi:hypothetical protein